MTDEELLRYSRQIMLPRFDVAGQEKLLAATVLILGLGGLGCPVAMYLAAAGVGHLMLADNDNVDLSNLQRQIAHETASIGRNKASSASDTVRALNPQTRITIIPERLTSDALMQTVAGASAVVDCTDNFSTRFALNKACVANKVPLISGAAIRMEGQISVFDSRVADSPCYHCLYEEGQDGDTTCSENGVIAPLTGIVGSIQAMECIKVLADCGTSLSGRLLLVDAFSMQFREMRLQKNPACSVCS
ncbi:MAG: molybdopterin-synthase adenylyltransferase MoeB [Pseudomonadota bacterium]